jgi:hypothetical protein
MPVAGSLGYTPGSRSGGHGEARPHTCPQPCALACRVGLQSRQRLLFVCLLAYHLDGSPHPWMDAALEEVRADAELCQLQLPTWRYKD